MPLDPDRVLDALNDHGVRDACPRCAATGHMGVDGSVTWVSLRDEGAAGPRGEFPAVVVMCHGCGHVMLHGLKPLGLA